MLEIFPIIPISWLQYICNNVCSKGSAILGTNGILSETLPSIVGKTFSLNQRQLANDASYFMILFDVSIDHLHKLTSRFRKSLFYCVFFFAQRSASSLIIGSPILGASYKK